MAESAAGQASRYGRVRPPIRSGRRWAVCAQAVPRAASNRRSRVVLHQALGAVALLVTLLLAALPVHARAPGPSAAESIVLEAAAVAVGAGHDISESTPSVTTSASVDGHPVQASRAGEIQSARAARVTSPLAGWYRMAAAEQGVSADLLRALHEVESNAAPDGCIANAEGSGAVGPFQFKRATFGQYGVDANHDGERDICSFPDALFSAARYLRALDAADLDDPQTRRALARYGTDPDRVLTLARSYRDRAIGKSIRE